MKRDPSPETPAVAAFNVDLDMLQFARDHSRAMLRESPMLRVADNVAQHVAGVELFHRVDHDRHIVKAVVTLPHTKLESVYALLAMLSSAHQYHHTMQSLLGDYFMDASTLLAATNPTDSLSLHWLTLQLPEDVATMPNQPQDFVYLHYTSVIHSHLVSLWHSVPLKTVPPQPHVHRASFHQSGFVVTKHPATGHVVASLFLSDVAPSTSTAPKALCHIAARIASRLAPTLAMCTTPPSTPPPTKPKHRCRVCKANLSEKHPHASEKHPAKSARVAVVCSICLHCVCLSCARPKPLSHLTSKPLHLCIHCCGAASPRSLATAAHIAPPGSTRSHVATPRPPPSPPRHAAAPPSPASSSYSSSFSASSSPSSAKPTSVWTPRHTLALASIPSAMFPHVQKSADRLVVTPELEADMRELGEAAVESLLGAMRLPMKRLADLSLQGQSDVALFEDATSNLYTVKAVVVLPPYDVLELLALLDMRSTACFRHTMRTLLDGAFVDGAVLHAAPPSSSQSAESMTLNWLAVQNAKVHLPHRDYVFLKYGNCYGRRGRGSPRRPVVISSSTTSVNQPRPLKDTVAVSVWESVDMTECGPLPNDLNIMRLHFRRCGYVLEQLPPSRNGAGGIQVSFFMSDEVPPSRRVSPLGKAWVVRMAQSVTKLHLALVQQYVAEGRQRRLDLHIKPAADSRCHCCAKRFSILRRRHHCHLCSEHVCKRCLDKQFQVVLCVTCRLPASVSLFKYWAS